MKIPPPGAWVDIGGRRLHFHRIGQAGPVVLFEAGIAASSLSWAPVQRLVAEFSIAIGYDRAGYGWSDPAPHRSTAADSAADLELLIARAALPTPVILVGHSFGGLIARVFQQRNPALVSGLVLVDPVCRAEWRESTPRLDRGVRLSRRGAVLARLGVVRLALNLLLRGSRSMPRLLARASAGQGSHVAERIAGEVRKIPPELWPAIAQHWSEARSFLAMAASLENLPVSVSQLDESRSLGDLPLIVLSAANASPAALSEHQAEARLSSRGEHRILAAAGHWAQLDQPEAIADAIRTLIARLGLSVSNG